MSKSVWMLTGACALTVMLTGCAPDLDQTPLSPEEQAWAECFKNNYGAWQPPESVPRAVRRDDLAGAQTPAAATRVNSSAIPPAIEQPSSALPTIEQQPQVPSVPAQEAAPVPVEVVDTPAEEVAPVTQAAAASEEYTVVKGDSLGSIALKYYGRASAWKKIQKANMQVLRGKNKDVIRPGMKLTIPRP